MFSSYICALDIGSSKISAVVARLKKKHILELYFESVSSKGVSCGVIVDSIELIKRLEHVLKNLEAKSGINIKAVHADISGKDIVTRHSRAILPLAERGNKVITLSDIHKVNEQARILGSSLEEEIIHQIPYSYSIDSKGDIVEPLGLYSHRLEADLYLVLAKMASVQTVTRVINQAGFELRNLYLSGIATTTAVFGGELKEGVNVLCDIGSDITEIIIFKDSLLKDIEILKLGGNDFTEEIHQMLKIPFELAEEVKKSYASIGDSTLIEEGKEILIKKESVYKPIKQKYLCEILTLKAKVFSNQIKKSVEKTVACNQINNFFVTGKVVLMDGFLEIFENTLEIPVRLGRINNPQIAHLVKKYDELSGHKYLTYLTSLGIIFEALKVEQSGIISLGQPTGHNAISRLFNRAKEVYQEYF